MMTLSNPRGFPLAERLRRWQAGAEDWWFEHRHGLELSQLVPHDELVSSNQAALPHATAYMGAWCRNVRSLVAQARRCNPALHHFVDLGSGKGKACFVASTQMAFDQIIGVEFSEPLVAQAQRNGARFGAGNVRFECGDAGDFELPDGATLVFMFNPFDGVILERFLQRNRAHFARHRSLVGYANDVQRAVLREQGFETVFRDPARMLSLHRLP